MSAIKTRGKAIVQVGRQCLVRRIIARENFRGRWNYLSCREKKTHSVCAREMIFLPDKTEFIFYITLTVV